MMMRPWVRATLAWRDGVGDALSRSPCSKRPTKPGRLRGAKMPKRFVGLMSGRVADRFCKAAGQNSRFPAQQLIVVDISGAKDAVDVTVVGEIDHGRIHTRQMTEGRVAPHQQG